MSSLKAKFLLLLRDFRFKVSQRLGAEFQNALKGFQKQYLQKKEVFFISCAVHRKTSSQPPVHTSIKLIVQTIYLSLVT